MYMHSLLDQVYVRQELWKYRRHFDFHEKGWMNAAFKNLDINSMSTRVSIMCSTSLVFLHASFCMCTYIHV